MPLILLILKIYIKILISKVYKFIMKILVIQNRMGIGDTVIFLPFIEAISEKFKVPVSLLVQQNSKSDQYLNETDYIDDIIILQKNNKIKNLRHNGFIGSLKLALDLKKYKFDKVFIFNSSLRFNIIARTSGIKDINQFPLFKKRGQDMIQASYDLIYNNLGIKVLKDPSIQVSDKRVSEAASKFNISQNNLNILLGIGGSGPSKRIPAKTYLKIMEKISKKKNCKFFLATGLSIDEQNILNEIKNSAFKNNCISLDKFSINQCLPIIKNCHVSICNDTSFSHLSSALGIKTITLMADTPLIYGSYSSKMHPIIPDGETTVSHNTLGKDKINPDKIYKKLLSIID